MHKPDNPVYVASCVFSCACYTDLCVGDFVLILQSHDSVVFRYAKTLTVCVCVCLDGSLAGYRETVSLHMFE